MLPDQILRTLLHLIKIINLNKTNSTEVLNIINSLDNKYSVDNVNISKLIVKTSTIIAPYLGFIINLSFFKDVFSKKKICKAKVSSLHKEDSKAYEMNI